MPLVRRAAFLGALHRLIERAVYAAGREHRYLSTRMGRCGSSTRSYSGYYCGVTISVGASTLSLTCSRTGGHPGLVAARQLDTLVAARSKLAMIVSDTGTAHRDDLARQPPLAGRAQPRMALHRVGQVGPERLRREPQRCSGTNASMSMCPEGCEGWSDLLKPGVSTTMPVGLIRDELA